MPQIPEDQRLTVVPDGVCEILSNATGGKDRRIRMPLYAQYGVDYLWLIDPLCRILEPYV